jgi:hypothetical protein
MAAPQPPLPVKYFIAILYKERTAFKKAFAEIRLHWGAVDFEGDDHLFDVTDYYEPEMGAPLYRRLISLEKLLPPELLAQVKHACNDIEYLLGKEGKRTVNLDVGYLDHNKALLASAKEAGQKIYLDKGIYADLVGRYKAGKYQPFEWTFPDFKDDRYTKELLAMRTKYLEQIREWKQQMGNGSI